MAFTMRVPSAASPERVWSVVADPAGHGRFFPATTMTTDPGEPRVGWGFVGHSGVGPLRFRDTMVLTEWAPQERRFRLAKLGPVLLGWAEVTVEPGSAGGSVLVWSESALPKGLPSPLHGLGDRLGQPFYDRVLHAMVAEAERTPG